MLSESREPVLFGGASGGPLAVYEGLPHQVWESDLFRQERARPDVIELAGWPFYADVVKLAPDAVDSLTIGAAGSEAFIEFGGEKRCGGFHPDFALQFGSALVLLCFGCGEALLVDAGVRRRVDVRAALFHEMLGSIRRHRPPAARSA